MKGSVMSPRTRNRILYTINLVGVVTIFVVALAFAISSTTVVQLLVAVVMAPVLVWVASETFDAFVDRAIEQERALDARKDRTP